MEEVDGEMVESETTHEITPIVSSHRRAWKIQSTAIVVVLAVAGTTLGLTTFSGSAGADAVVQDAVAGVTSASSVTMNVKEEIQTSGLTVNVSGSDACDFSVPACSVQLNFTGVLSQIGTENVIYANGTLYDDVGETPQASDYQTPWIAIPYLDVSQTGGTSPSDPLSGLSVLEASGAVVTDEGTVTVDGQSMTQYKVVVPESAVKSLATGRVKLPTWMQSALKEVRKGTTTELVDVTESGQLGQVSIAVNETANGAVVRAAVVETVTGIGVPVNITIPPASEVTNYSSPSALEDGNPDTSA